MKLTVIRSYGEMTTYSNAATTKDIFSTLTQKAQADVDRNRGWHIQNIEQSVAENSNGGGAVNFYAYLTVVFACDMPAGAPQAGGPSPNFQDI